VDITIPNNWNPRAYQGNAWNYLIGGGKRLVEVAHRRWGKDDIALHWTAVSALEKPATYWHMLPEATQARKAIWNAVNPHTGMKRIDEAFPMEIRAATRQQEMMIEFVNGSTWQLVGSDNYNSLIGSPPYGVIFSEYSVANPAAWAYLRPILAENGGWAVFIYTARGKNHGYNLYNSALESDDWFCEKSTADDTELKELQSEFGDDAGRAYWLQEYFCSFDAAIPGAYYMGQLAEAEKQNRITKVPYDKRYPVHTWWDIGSSDYTSIWFAQYVGREIRIIDYYQNSGQGPDFYLDILENKGYKYGGHNLPHDAGHAQFTLGGRCVKDQLQDLSPNAEFNVHPVTRSVQADINVARSFMSRCVWDREKCQVGLECLGSYAKKWDDKNKIFKDKPHHDWASHGADAFRYLAIGYAEESDLQMPYVDDNNNLTFAGAMRLNTTLGASRRI
jgi:hypothetical protein